MSTEYLMTSQQGWKPEMALPRQMTPTKKKRWMIGADSILSDKFPSKRRSVICYDGIPASEGYAVMGDEAVLINPEPPPKGAASTVHRSAKSTAAEKPRRTESGEKPVAGEAAGKSEAENEAAATRAVPVRS